MQLLRRTVESHNAIDGPVMLRGAAVDVVKQWVYAPYTTLRLTAQE